MNLRVLTIAMALMVARTAFAGGDAGTESPFSFGAGARDLALGGASSAISDPTTGPFWNPSRLAAAERLSVAAFHSRMYESSVAYQYFGLAVPTMDLGTFGLGVFRLGVDGIEKRDAGNLLLGEIDDSRLAMYVAYGRTISNYAFGVAATLQHHSLDTYKATSSPGLNISVGRRFDTGTRWLQDISIALNARNVVQPGMKLLDETVKEPYGLECGIALGIAPSNNQDHKLNLSTTVAKADYVSTQVAFGLEYDMANLLHIRGGLRDERLSFGAGLTYKSLSFDYALVDRDLGSIHMFTITSCFGKPVSEKRQERVQRQEVEFNNLMSQRLTSRNLQMINDLAQRGRDFLASGDLNEAENHIDRALFLARASGEDTSRIHFVAVQIREQIEAAELEQRYLMALDSAGARFAGGDYISARYFANLALADVPESSQAKDLLSHADRAIGESVAKEELIRSRLWAVDSLLGYGHVLSAVTVIKSLNEYAPEHSGVILAAKRVGLEQWREEAAAAYAQKDYPSALNALDSALMLFPGHQWCSDLRDRINAELRRARVQQQAEVLTAVAVQPLSSEVQREVEADYRSAQKAFQNGDLADAIAKWEQVERIAPDYQSVREYLASAYRFVGVELYGQNLLEEAVAIWKKALNLNPENSELSNYVKRTETEIMKLKELSYEQ